MSIFRNGDHYRPAVIELFLVKPERFSNVYNICQTHENNKKISIIEEQWLQKDRVGGKHWAMVILQQLTRITTGTK